MGKGCPGVSCRAFNYFVYYSEQTNVRVYFAVVSETSFRKELGHAEKMTLVLCGEQQFTPIKKLLPETNTRYERQISCREQGACVQTR